MNITFQGITLLAIALADAVLFFYFLRYEKTITIKAYLAFIAGVFLWVLSNALSYLSNSSDITLFQKFSYLGGTIITASFLLFIHSFPFPTGRIVHALKWFAVAFSIIVAILLFGTDVLVSHIEMVGGKAFQFVVQPGLIIWSFLFVILWTLAVYELIQRYVGAAGETRKRLQYLVIGISISLVMGLISDVIFPLTAIQNYPWIGPTFSLVWLWYSVKAVRV